MADEAVISTPETGPDTPAVETPAKDTAQPEAQSQESQGPQHQPDGGVDPKLLESEVPSEASNVEKVETDGSKPNSIDSKVPEGMGDKSEWLHNILAKEKENPEPDFSEDELDILDEYYEGRLEPKKPTEKSKETEPEEKSEEVDNSIEAVLKEVGAKSQDELLGKIKDLRKVVSGKVKGHPEFKQLQQDTKEIQTRFQNELNLMEDVKSGIPGALQHLESVYGIKIQRPGDPEPKTEQPKEDVFEDPKSENNEYLDDVAGREITGLKKQIKELTSSVKTLSKNNDKVQEKFAGERAEAQIIDEMVQVAETVPQLKDIKALRSAIKSWRGGKEDSRLDGFQKVFNVANEKNVDLVTAYEILAGRSASKDIVRARHEAKKEVYSQKPNRSLSEIQGKGVTSKPSYSDEQVVDMIENNNVPEDWYDKNDNPNMQTIPRQYLKYFFSPQEIRK